MNWKKYKVSFYCPSDYLRIDLMFNYFIIEALNSKDAIKMAKSSYKQAKELRNLPELKKVNFSATKI